MFLLDSDVLIYFLKGKKDVVDKIRNFQEEIFISTISVGEVYEGLFFSKNKQKEKFIKIFMNFLETVNILPVDTEIAKQFAILRGNLRRQGELIDNFDLLIAATCRKKDLTLVTGNTQHFLRIPNLEIVNINE